MNPSPTQIRTTLAAANPALVIVDCFGTLLHRSAPSGRVRELACAELSTALGARGLASPPDAARLVTARRDLERTLSRSLSAPGRPQDHSTPDLARALHGWLAADGPTVAAADELVDLVCEIETAAESAVCTANRELADALGTVDAPVVVVSDTNLTAPMLEEVLAAHGLAGLATRVVTSADAGETKRSGHLLPLVIAEAGVDPSSVVVIGDNPRADGEMAEAAGAHPLLVRPGRWDATKQAPPRALGRDLSRRLRDVLAPDGPDDVFAEMALTLWLFSTRLDRDLRRREADRAVFLAREGLFLRRIHAIATAPLAHRGRPPLDTAYLLTSRKSTLLPSLLDPGTELLPLVTRRRLGPADLAALVGLPADLLLAALPPGASPDAPLDAAGAAAIVADADVTAAIEARRTEQTSLLRDLVTGVAPGDGELHLVDVGWKGTVRDQLAPVLAPRTVHAHLLGLLGDADLGDLDHKTGHLFANRPQRSEHLQVFAHFKELYELLLAAGHGSVSHYRRDDAGEVVAVLDEHPDERRCHDEIVAPFQERCATRAEALATLLAPVRDLPPWVVDVVAAAHARMVYRPRRPELEVVEALVQYENFGARAVQAIGGGPAAVDRPWYDPRRHVSGGGWPPLRMRRAGAGWQRVPYGAFKEVQRRRGALR